MTTAVTRRGALAALAGLAFAPLGLDEAFAAAGPRVSRIHVDVSRLRARRGEPTARWVAEDMPEAVARALGAAFCARRSGRRGPQCACRRRASASIRSGGARIIDEISGFVSARAAPARPRAGAPSAPSPRSGRRRSTSRCASRPIVAGCRRSSAGSPSRSRATWVCERLGLMSLWPVMRALALATARRPLLPWRRLRSRRRPWLARAPTRRKRRSAAGRRSFWSGRSSR